MPICLTCRQVIQVEYVEIDGVGPFCRDCRQNRPPCEVCGAPLSDDFRELSDGRRSCVRCNLSAVYAPADAITIYGELKDIIAQNLGLTLNIPTGLGLVDRKQLAEIIRLQSDNNGIMDVERTLGIYARRGIGRNLCPEWSTAYSSIADSRLMSTHMPGKERTVRCSMIHW